ncbi:hypothetical protein G7K_2042-t1 [Saitoella complicata NRRL Y-17804]|uniref:Uncharacterized protein n=1 Tax=Saitoella complicata (strain BCRC 22490 / CBS 7301 / JCM 7358 / NBRC 10748 / NRRL Y-17804) TaxID=698492 RepID=A0A0E9NDN9_SAICN|nr:hypothetical protein G7K_2042-t1 [Saitoella complicata NRRL Y-17804]
MEGKENGWERTCIDLTLLGVRFNNMRYLITSHHPFLDLELVVSIVDHTVSIGASTRARLHRLVGPFAPHLGGIINANSVSPVSLKSTTVTVSIPVYVTVYTNSELALFSQNSLARSTVDFMAVVMTSKPLHAAVAVVRASIHSQTKRQKAAHGNLLFTRQLTTPAAAAAGASILRSLITPRPRSLDPSRSQWPASLHLSQGVPVLISLQELFSSSVSTSCSRRGK